MKDIITIIFFLAFSSLLCKATSITTLEEPNKITKMEVHANELFKITLNTPVNNRALEWIVAKISDNTKSPIQLVASYGVPLGPKNLRNVGKRPVDYFFYASQPSNEPIQILFVLRATKRITGFSMLEKRIFKITILPALPKKVKEIEVKANQAFNITLAKTFGNDFKNYEWELKEKKDSSVIKFVKKEDGEGYVRRGCLMIKEMGITNVFTFEAGNASNEKVTLEFAEFSLKNLKYFNSITYVIKIVN